MKKILVIIGFIVALSFTFQSCTEEVITPKAENDAENVGEVKSKIPGQF